MIDCLYYERCTELLIGAILIPWHFVARNRFVPAILKAIDE